MNEVDKRVVQMEFDNAKFEKNIDQTMKTLEDLNKMLQMRDASKGFDSLIGDSNELAKSMDGVGQSVDEVKYKLSSLQVIGYTVLSELTKTAMRVGNEMASAFWSPIVAGGARRAQNIEAAKFQLEGLGVAWKDISDDINYGVKDTAYGLDSAARVASQLVASQIMPGELMRNALRGISGVAAMTNSSYDEIGSIFTTVAGNNKLMTMQLRQLSYRGLNAAATLAKYLDTTEQDIYDMVSKGKISFETFAKAMDETFGDHAKEANKTFSGAMSNVNAALARIGAKFADPVYDTLRQVFVELIPVINAVNRIIDPVVEGFTTLLNLLKNSAKTLLTEDFAKAIGMLFLDIYSWLRPLIVALTKVGILGKNLNGVGTSMLGVLEKLQLYGSSAEKVEHFFLGIFGIIKLIYTIIKSIFIIVKPIFEAIIFGLGKIFGASGDLGEVMFQVSTSLSIIIARVSKLLSLKIEKALRVIGSLISKIDFNKVIKGIGIIINIIGIVIKAVILLTKVTFALIAGLVVAIPALVTSLISIFGKLGDIASVFTSKLSWLFGGKKKTAELELDTSVNGPSLSDILDEVNSSNKKKLDSYEKNVSRASDSLKELGETSKKTSDQVEKNAGNIRRASGDMADAAKEAKDSMSSLTMSNAGNSKGRDVNFKPEEEVKKNPIIRFFTALRDGIIFIAMGVVGAVVTAVTWVGSAIAWAFPALAGFLNALFEKLANFIKNINWYKALGYALEVLVIGAVLSVVMALMSIGGIIMGAGIALAGTGIATALGAFQSAIFAILAFLTAIAIIAEHVDIDKFDAVLNSLRHFAATIIAYVGFFGLFISVLNLFKAFKIANTNFTREIADIFSATRRFNAIANMLRSFALVILTITATLLIVNKMLPGTEFRDAVKKFIVIAIICLASLKLLSSIIEDLNYRGVKLGDTRTSTGGFGLFGRSGHFENTTERGLGGLIDVIFGLALYIGAVTLAMKVVSKLNWKDIAKGGAVIGGALAAIGVVIAIIAKQYRKMAHTWNNSQEIHDLIDNGSKTKKNQEYRKLDYTRGMEGYEAQEGGDLGGVADAIKAVGRYILTISIAMRIIGKMSWKDIRKGGAVLAGALAAITIVLAVLAKFTNTIDKSSKFTDPYGALNRRDAEKTRSYNDKQRSNMGAVANAIKSVAAFLVSVTASMVILSALPKHRLIRAGVTLTAALVVITVMIAVLAAINNRVSKFGKSDALPEILKHLSLLMLAIAGMFVIIGFADLKKINDNLPAIITIFGSVAAVMALIALIARLAPTGLTVMFSAMSGLSLFLAAVGATFLMLGWSDLNKISDNIDVICGILSSIVIIFGALVALQVAIDAFSGGVGGKAVFAIAAGVMGAFGVFLIAFAAAMSILSKINAEGYKNTMFAFADALDYLFDKLTFVDYVQLIAFAAALVPLGLGLVTLSLASPSKISAISESIRDLADAFSDGLGNSLLAVLAIIIILIAMLGALGNIAPIIIGVTVVVAIKYLYDKFNDNFINQEYEDVDAPIKPDDKYDDYDAYTRANSASNTGRVPEDARPIYARDSNGGYGAENTALYDLFDPDYYAYDPHKIPRDLRHIRDEAELTTSELEALSDMIDALMNEEDYEGLHLGSDFDLARGTEEQRSELEKYMIENILGYDPEKIQQYYDYISSINRGPGASSVGNAHQISFLDDILNDIIGLSKNGNIISDIGNSAVTLGQSLITGLYSTILSAKDKIKNATKELFTIDEPVNNQAKQFSNMSRILDEYGNSVTENITNRNKEAIESTKELANSINTSAKAMGNFSKSTSGQLNSNLSTLSKEMINLRKESTVGSDELVKSTAEQVGNAGKAAGHEFIKGFSWSEIGEDIMGFIGDTMENVRDGALTIVDTIAPGAVDAIADFLDDPFGALGSGLGSISGWNASDTFMEIFMGTTLKELKSMLSAQQTQTAAYARDMAANANAMNYYEEGSEGWERAKKAYLQSQSAYATSQGQVQAYMDQIDMWENHDYTKMVIGDLSDIFGDLGGLGTSGDYTSDMTSSIADSSGAGSGINDASLGGGTNINSNNTYNFTQNNYSPEALSRSDLYMQTRAQINAWYGWMRAQPAT